jgi:signal transduction histidine kinase
VTLVQQENKLILVINDNGKGFDINQKQKGIGLTNIIYRSELYHGNIQIHSKPGEGCTIQIEFSGL